MSGEPLAFPVRGGNLAAIRLGATRPDAPVVVAVHGITANSRSWRAVGRALGDRAALVAVDLRGRAASAALPPPFGVDAHVADLVAALDALELQRAVLAGHSLGAYVVARLAVLHPDRVAGLVLVDGGLTIPLPAGVEPEPFVTAFLARALERLTLTFPGVDAYLAWWREHPAFTTGEVADADLAAYAAHDLGGEPPELRCAINPQVVRDDGTDLFRITDAHAVDCPATLLHAPLGLTAQPPPMQPEAAVAAWAGADPGRRHGVFVDGTNHYTIAMGAPGSAAVADAIAAGLADWR